MKTTESLLFKTEISTTERKGFGVFRFFILKQRIKKSYNWSYFIIKKTTAIQAAAQNLTMRLHFTLV